jgi:hypothetical protein
MHGPRSSRGVGGINHRSHAPDPIAAPLATTVPRKKKATSLVWLTRGPRVSSPFALPRASLRCYVRVPRPALFSFPFRYGESTRETFSITGKCSCCLPRDRGTRGRDMLLLAPVHSCPVARTAAAGMDDCTVVAADPAACRVWMPTLVLLNSVPWHGPSSSPTRGLIRPRSPHHR